tara:strand:- start:621 stop:839 length:219 start_codon:yes stop_codon:yes gene_type:complete
MKKSILVSILLSVSFAVYNVGQTVSTSDQNVTLQGCSSISDYYNQEFKLADWNGATNGGDYRVIWLEMSASW